MSEKLSVRLNIDEVTALVFQHSRRAMQARKTAAELVAQADQDDRLAQVYKEIGKRMNREAEERESKMNIRKIISGVSVLVLLLTVLSVGSLTMAQDVPVATEAATTEATATIVPMTPPAPVNNGTDNTSAILDALKELALIAALIVLAFKVAGLVPADVMDKALARGFDLARGLADKTTTPIDNQILEIAQPIIAKLIADELAKRQGGAVNVTVQNPAMPSGDAIIDAINNARTADQG